MPRLSFGLFAGRWYTKEQLRILTINNEVKGLGSRNILVALLSGMTVFLIFSFYVLYFKQAALAISLIYFVISATFTMYLARMKLIRSWEKQEEKIIFADWNRIYALPWPPQPLQSLLLS